MMPLRMHQKHRRKNTVLRTPLSRELCLRALGTEYVAVAGLSYLEIFQVKLLASLDTFQAESEPKGAVSLMSLRVFT